MQAIPLAKQFDSDQAAVYRAQFGQWHFLLGYEVMIKCPGKTAVVGVTRLSEVKITDHTHDTALAASRSLNFYEPVGMMAFFGANLDTIDSDDADTSFFFHDYYASTRQVLSDIPLLLNENLPPVKRIPPLSAATQVLGHPLWSFISQQVASTAP